VVENFGEREQELSMDPFNLRNKQSVLYGD